VNRNTIDLWVGIFVALGIAGILFLALKVGNLVTFGNTPGYRLEARSTISAGSSSALRSGRPVLSSAASSGSASTRRRIRRS
jgi:phospholipid/cholesterol/gamma-HCH transport system substrate-binding protein